MHTLLARQLRRHFGDPGNVPAQLSAFIESVQETYVQADDDRAILEHSMETVSAELIERYRKLDDALSSSHAAKEDLDRAVSLLSATLDSSADGILVVDRIGRVAQMNRKFIELWHLPHEVIQSSFDGYGLVHILRQLANPARFTEQIQRLHHGPSEESFDALTLKDGRVIERYSVPQRLANEIVGRVWSFRDVTERERAIAQGRVLTARFMSAFGDAPIGMAIMSPDGEWTEVNRALAELLGRESATLIGRSPLDFTHPDDHELTRAAHERLRSGQERVVRLEKRYLHSSGRVVWTLLTCTILGDDSRAPFILSHLLDITDQRTAAESLRRQALVFETITEGVIVTDHSGRIVDVNPAVQSMFGYARHELIGQTPAIWQRNDEGQPILSTIQDALRTDGRWSGEYDFNTKDGRVGVVESTISTLRDATGQLINAIGVTRDITERRQMDRQLLQAQKLEAIGSLAAGVAHEINTPTQYVGDNVQFLGDGLEALIGVVGEARALADAARDHPELTAAVATFDHATQSADADYLQLELPRAADQAREGCERISEIVKAMKGFTHHEGAQWQLVDLNTAVRDSITVCRNEWRYVATLTTEFDEAMPPVACLPGELQQVVLNLVVNAAHAVSAARDDSGSLGSIVVSTHHDGEWAEIRVRDDGCGIPESIAGKVFDPFFTTKAVGRGTGQGLSIAHATIVRKHHGLLTFESQEGKGTTFIIRIPISGTAEPRQQA